MGEPVNVIHRSHEGAYYRLPDGRKITDEQMDNMTIEQVCEYDSIALILAWWKYHV